MFYYSKTSLFEVLEGLESLLFGVVFRAQFLDVIFRILLQTSCHFGCPRAPKGSPWGDLEITHFGQIFGFGPQRVPRSVSGCQIDPFWRSFGGALGDVFG